MFATQISIQMLEKMVGSCINHTKKRKLKTAVDATGFELEDGSYHYLKRLGKAAKQRKSLKLSACAETDKHFFYLLKSEREYDMTILIVLFQSLNSMPVKPIILLSTSKTNITESFEETNFFQSLPSS